MYVREGRKHRRDKTTRKEPIQTPFSPQIRAVKWSGIQLQRTITTSMHFHAFFIGICLDIVGKRLRVVVRQDVRMGHWQSNGLRISELMQLVVFRKFHRLEFEPNPISSQSKTHLFCVVVVVVVGCCVKILTSHLIFKGRSRWRILCKLRCRG